ncbi:B3/B4 domain-containing protein [Phreatobacter oligotrophus]|uniref:DNA/RNA-binding domain of Phe-tRNA-synthetase-like protein n=1 Tax=Phreatobacter oligotrophus TaxID=1122261 RepID=A0A2T4Z104_9HYPH|nr:phenylalanine--tRNA ligase beta subunit-related protein [Phreatobacter oligotrophus]PTM53405.1 DNA/RNA-binding domain of Phe-tRNA-synthetase-like protein [Phreatobacter oligotrophus]
MSLKQTPVTLTIAELTERFPDFRVAVLVCEGLAIPASRPPALDALIAEREAEARMSYAGTDLSAIPGIAAWRAAYKGFGIKKTSYRCSVERLMKNALAERPLPAINPFVDAYNAASLAAVACVGADDLDKAEGPFAFRFARPDDTFIDMATEAGEDPNDPPKDGEVVYAGAGHVLCRRWNWRQDARSIITPSTQRAIVTVQTNGWGHVEAAAADAADLITRFCGGRVTTAIADQDRPTVTFD